MMIAVIVIACLIAQPTQCETINTEQSVASEAACQMAGEMWAATRLRQEWYLDEVRCEVGFVDEDHG